MVWKTQALCATVRPKQPEVCHEPAFPRAGVAFSDMHIALAQVVAGYDAALEARARQMDELACEGRYPSGPCVPAVSRAFAAFERRNFSAAIKRLNRLSASSNASAVAAHSST
jgi:hypothetical protein